MLVMLLSELSSIAMYITQGSSKDMHHLQTRENLGQSQTENLILYACIPSCKCSVDTI